MKSPARRVRAVTFDFWDTLVRADPARPMRELQIAAVADALAQAGHERDPALLDAAFDANWQRFEDAWIANRGQYTTAHASDYLAEHLRVPLDGELRARIIASFERAGTGAGLEPAPGLANCLERLSGAGILLAIVCDVGLTPSSVLRARLDGLGLLARFRAWSFSDETGRFKPAPEAFHAALDPLGVSPEEAAHVGDNPRTDVAGAKDLGMVALRFRGFRDVSDGGPEADAVLADLQTLPELLGV
jgi:HAD superfamily hydrolase (TIGR01549 family)